MTQRNLIKIFGYLCNPIFEIIQLSSSTVSFLVSLLLVDYLLLRVMLGDLARQSRFMLLLSVLKVFFRGPHWFKSLSGLCCSMRGSLSTAPWFGLAKIICFFDQKSALVALMGDVERSMCRHVLIGQS